MIRRTIVHRKNRRQLDPSNTGLPVFATPAASTPSGSTAVLTFTTPMTLGPVGGATDPTTITCGAAHLVSVAVTSPTVFVLTFSAAVSTNDVVIPSNCPTFRTYQGGYATPGSYPTS
jgi:hypothetical protein